MERRIDESSEGRPVRIVIREATPSVSSADTDSVALSEGGAGLMARLCLTILPQLSSRPSLTLKLNRSPRAPNPPRDSGIGDRTLEPEDPRTPPRFLGPAAPAPRQTPSPPGGPRPRLPQTQSGLPVSKS